MLLLVEAPKTIIILAIGDTKGNALMRKRENGPDLKRILRKAIEEAASNAGAAFIVEDGTMYLEPIE